MNAIVFLLAAACIASPCLSFASASDSKERHTVSTDPWDGVNSDVWKKLDVRLDGKSIGPFEVAFKKLEEIPVKRGEHIRVDLSTRFGRKRAASAYHQCNFMQRWMAKGALIDLYLDGKKLNTHTVTWKRFDWGEWMRHGGLMKTMDDVTWEADGKVVGNGAELLKLVKQWEREKRVAILVLKPSLWRHPNLSLQYGTAYSRIWELWEGDKIPVYFVTPEDEYIEGFN